MANKDKNTLENTQKIVSPTQAQMDEWIQEELAEAETSQMLSDDYGALFTDVDSKSID